MNGDRGLPRQSASDVRVVFINPTGFLGGAELCLLDLLASQRAARPDWPARVILGDDGPLREAVTALGVQCDLLPLPPALAGLGDAGLSSAPGARRGAAGLALLTRGPRAAAALTTYLHRLRRMLRTMQADIIQTNGMKAHLIGTLAAPRAVPVVWHMHDFCGSRPLMARLLRTVSSLRRPGSVRVVGVSHAVADDAARVLGPTVPVSAIYNAVDLKRFSPGPGDGPGLDRAAGLPPAPAGTVRVGLVATYARWKGHDVFLEAVAQVDPDVPARFYVVGGPLYRTGGSQYSLAELQGRAAALGVTGRVGFVPHHAAPEEIFRSLDVVVHASTRPEPFGRVIVEAMACGRAVIAADAGGASELFESDVTAVGCPPGNPAALATAMTQLVTDPERSRMLGEAARRDAATRFDRAALADIWTRFYCDRTEPQPGSQLSTDRGLVVDSEVKARA